MNKLFVYFYFLFNTAIVGTATVISIIYDSPEMPMIYHIIAAGLVIWCFVNIFIMEIILQYHKKEVKKNVKVRRPYIYNL